MPAATFCDVHVIEQIPGEQRLIVAYYSQGTKILDYDVDEQGRWSFRETASIVFPNANTWASDMFKVVDNEDGTPTYHVLASDTNRGVDIFTWRGEPNLIRSSLSSVPRTSRSAAADTGAAMLVSSGLVSFAAWRRRVTSARVRTPRRSRARSGA